MNYYDEAKAIFPQLIQWRRDLHQIPEIGINLPKTVKYVSKALEDMGIGHQVFEDVSCIFATIGKGDRCILLRADMDGLEVPEESGLEFACKEGRMHACGHDMHTTNLLGAAKILKEHEDELDVVVKLLFQSGEEVFKGAAAAIDAGVLDNPKVDAAYGMHIFDMIPLNSIQWGEIGFGAVYGFKITLTGVGGHGSQPERCIDPINAAVQVYLALQSLIARELSPNEEATLTIGQLAAGQAANAIPETAVLQGTLRTFKADVRNMLITRIGEVCENVAKTYRCKCDIEVLSDVPSVKCDKEFSEFCLDTIKNIGFLKGEIDKNLHLMGSEDFAFISEKVPSCYCIIGSGDEDPAKRLGQHNPKINFNEEAMISAVSAFVAVAMEWGEK